MQLIISKEKTIQEIQQDFSAQYPFLKLEFYKMHDKDPFLVIKRHLPHSITLRAAGLKNEGTLEVNDGMSVGELEKAFLDQFGLDMQVSRKSGIVWLQTTMTDSWTLGKQNQHGREISVVSKDLHFDEADSDNN